MDDDNIRPPDISIRERLLPASFGAFNIESEEDQMRRALEESETDYELQFAIAESNRAIKEREERVKYFAPFKSKIIQFTKLDADSRDFYAELVFHIENYESGGINTIHLGDELYDRFRRMLDNMRLSTEFKTRLLSIILL
jgi:hypothetical protein